jgi:hypothetical protein
MTAGDALAADRRFPLESAAQSASRGVIAAVRGSSLGHWEERIRPMSDLPMVAGRAASPRTRWFTYAAIFAAVVAWGLLDVQRRGRVEPAHPEVHRTDFTAYTEAGGAFFDGRDPYGVTNVRGWGYCYPPLFALLVSPLYRLDPRWQVLIWFFISAAFAWGLYRECAKLFTVFAGLAPRKGAPWSLPTWVGWAALAAATLPALNCLQRGQVDLVKLYLVVAGFRLSLTGTTWRAWFIAGIALAAAIVLKITPILPAGFLLCVLSARFVLSRPADSQSAIRFTAVTGGVAVGAATFLLVIPGMILGWHANLGYLNRFYHDKLLKANDYLEADKTGNQRTLRNQSFSNAAIRLGDFLGYEFLGGPDDRLIDRQWRDAPAMVMDAPGVERVLLAARAVAALLLVAAGLACVWRQDVLGQAATIAMACTAALVISPISRGSYYAELAPAVLLLPLWLVSRGMPRAAQVMAWIPGALVMAHYFALPITGRIGLLGIGTAAWYATGLVLLTIGGRLGERSTAAVPAPLARHRGRQPATAGSLT